MSTSLKPEKVPLGIVKRFNACRTSRYVAAKRWYDERGWDGEDGPIAKYLREYAEKRYAEHVAIIANLDKKLQWTFGIAAALAGVAFTLQKTFASNPLLSVPTVALAAMGMLLCLKGNTPVFRPTPVSTQALSDYGKNVQSIDRWLAASLHCACVGLRLNTEFKAAHIKGATWAILVGAILLALPMLLG